MVKRSRLRRSSGARKQRLVHGRKSVLQRYEDFRSGIRDVLHAMSTKRTYAVYQSPNILLSKRYFGGLKGLRKEIQAVLPNTDFRLSVVKKGKLSSDIRVSNITPNEAILLNSFFMARGGVIRMFQ